MNRLNQHILTFGAVATVLINAGCAHKDELQITPTPPTTELVKQYAYVGELHNQGLQALFNQLTNKNIAINSANVDAYLKTTHNTTETFFTDYHTQHPTVNLFGTQQGAEQVFAHQRARLMATVAAVTGSANASSSAWSKTSSVSSSADFNATVSQAALSDKQKTLLTLVSEASDNATSPTEFSASIELVETRAAAELPADEQPVVFVVTSTAKASAAYWNDHGKEWAALTGNAHKPTAQNRVEKGGINWWKFALKCAIADAGGAITGGGVLGAVVGSGIEAANELIGG